MQDDTTLYPHTCRKQNRLASASQQGLAYRKVRLYTYRRKQEIQTIQYLLCAETITELISVHHPADEFVPIFERLCNLRL